MICGDSSSFQINMITRISATNGVIVSWRTNSNIKGVNTSSTNCIIRYVKRIKIQTKLANIGTYGWYSIFTTSCCGVRGWIRWILNVSAIVGNGWTTSTDKKCTAHSKTRSAVAINWTSFVCTFSGWKTCSIYRKGWSWRWTSTLTK